ncbi:MAG: 50S ribosomal protein L17 [Candidatus Eremiobacteraeota bacterium]|nr:50S ribosomal protein L17 [Candidatus Eremiobacteraeota bacterium]
MRHKRRSRRLGRRTGHRMSMFKNLATSFIIHKRITTTLTRAKEVQRIIDHLINLAKRGDLAAKRQVFKFIKSREAATDLFDVIAPQYRETPDQAERMGGYTRIIKIGPRHGDASPMVFLELA